MPTSPSKNSVKFEDGVVPGEGRDGERTLPRVPEPVQVPVPKKNQNAIERTVWTLIMIFGFIGESDSGQAVSPVAEPYARPRPLRAG